MSKKNIAMSDTQERLDSRVKEALAGIGLCFREDLLNAAATLLYSAIDMMAWLDRPTTKDDVDGVEFRRWVATYMLPGSGLSCTPTDIYAARCGVVHSGTPLSKLYRLQQAKQIIYGKNPKNAEDLKLFADCIAKKEGWPQDYIVLDFEALILAFADGCEKFATSLEGDPARTALVDSRINKQLIYLKHEPKYDIVANAIRKPYVVMADVIGAGENIQFDWTDDPTGGEIFKHLQRDPKTKNVRVVSRAP